MIGYTTTPLATMRNGHLVKGPAPEPDNQEPTLEHAKAHPFEFPRIAAMFEDEIAAVMHREKIATPQPPKNYKQAKQNNAKRIAARNKRFDDILEKCQIWQTTVDLDKIYTVSRDTIRRDLTSLLVEGRIEREEIRISGAKGYRYRTVNK